MSRNRSLLHAPAFLTIAGLLLGCGATPLGHGSKRPKEGKRVVTPDSEDGESDFEERAIAGKERGSWIELEREAMIELQRTKTFENNLLAEDDPLTLRVQHWLDRLTEAMAGEAGADPAMPPPRAMVTRSRFPNAYVRGHRTCKKVPLGRAGMDTNLTDDKASYLVELRGDRLEFVAGASPDDCDRTVPANELDLSQMADELMAAIPECRIEVVTRTFSGPEGSGEARYLEAEDACFYDTENSRHIVFAGAVSFVRTSNWITVYTPILELDREEALVATLAHELGHYQLGHVGGSSRGYFYVYEVASRRESGRPAPSTDPTHERYGTLAVETMAAFPPTPYEPFPGARFHPALFNAGTFVPTSLALFEKEHSAGAAHCQALAEAIKQQDFESLVRVFNALPRRSYTSEEQALYMAYEEKLGRCVDNLPLAHGLDAESWRYMFAVLGRTQLPTRLWQAHGDAKTLGELMDRMDPSLSELESDGRRAVRKVRELGLSFYTQEEEADEFSVKALDRLELDVGAAVDLPLDLETFAGMPSGDTWAIPADECRALYQRGWKEESGAPVTMSVGNWTDPHHDGCFRAFNASQEIIRGSFEQRPSQEQEGLPGGRWQDVQSDAKSRRR